jgi:hypothetical protein
MANWYYEPLSSTYRPMNSTQNRQTNYDTNYIWELLESIFSIHRVKSNEKEQPCYMKMDEY